MHCLYAPDLISQKTFQLDEGESHHLANVLRATNGDLIKITNGVGQLFDAAIIEIHKKRTQVHIINTFTRTPGAIHIAISPVKTNERLGFTLEKLTELNVTSIIPILTQNGERRVFNADKEMNHLIAAIKQSQNPFLPKLHPITRFETFVTSDSFNLAQKLICHCRETRKTSLVDAFKPGNDVLICIGPEGDFTLDEVKSAESNGFTSVSLGNEVLRAETAAIAATVAIKTINQMS
jgi:16S rRNA (uracil1498-N3)-methyltransferase